MNRNLYLIYIVFAFTISGCSQTKETNSTDEEVANAQPEETAQPADHLFTDLEGNHYNLSDFEGNTVFMNYWATWCRPCLAEMPDIDSARIALQEEGIQFLLVSDEPLKKIRRFREKQSYGFRYLKLNAAFTDQDVYSLPTTIIYRKDGSIGFKKVGAMDWDSPKVLETIRSYNK